MTTDHLTAWGQEALREAVLKMVTGSVNENALLKEHYDSLHELTNISKKTLKRFFKEKSQIGAQTRNLLAAIALGKKEELGGFSDKPQEYYLTFLESLGKPDQHIRTKPATSTAWEFGNTLATVYKSEHPENLFIPLYGRRRRAQGDVQLTEQPQEVQLTRQRLINHRRSAIIGDAGLGKTTLAKFICLDWSEKDDPDQDIPIYIDLKNPTFNRQEQGIVRFVLSTYFQGSMDWMVLDFLENYPDRYYLLLDGFDDLTSKEKEILMKELAVFSAHVRFIVLGRDYSFDDFNHPIRSTYEIAGLDLKSQENLIGLLMQEPHSTLELSSLLTYIHSHHVLSTLSRSPLWLSRIVELVNTQHSFSLLENIGSSVDLQYVYDKYVRNR